MRCSQKHDRQDIETFFFGRMIKKLHPLYSSPTKLARSYQFLPLQRCRLCQIWMLLFPKFSLSLCIELRGNMHSQSWRHPATCCLLFGLWLRSPHLHTPDSSCLYMAGLWLSGQTQETVGSHTCLQMTTGCGQMWYSSSGGVRRKDQVTSGACRRVSALLRRWVPVNCWSYEQQEFLSWKCVVVPRGSHSCCSCWQSKGRALLPLQHDLSSP